MLRVLHYLRDRLAETSTRIAIAGLLAAAVPALTQTADHIVTVATALVGLVVVVVTPDRRKG